MSLSDSTNKSSAQLEREVQEQRDRVEARIGEIKHRLSPGQLLDEALSYSKHGGAHFAQNFAAQITANPLPAALVGIGLAWLIGSNATGQNGTMHSHAPAPSPDAHSYPYASIGTGGLRRVSHTADESGDWWAEFESTAGQRYRARTDQSGARAGHFTDQAGRMFSGFIDDAGNRVRDFRDEAGNMLSDAQGWANHNWNGLANAVSAGLGAVGSAAQHAVSGVSGAVSGAMSGLSANGQNVGATLSQQSDQLVRQASALFDRQPLVVGALAFAAGAALGATLPHTPQEDQLIGEPADKIRRKAVVAAGDLYQQGKEVAGKTYRDMTDKAAGAYDDLKDRVAPGLDAPNGLGSTARH